MLVRLCMGRIEMWHLPLSRATRLLVVVTDAGRRGMGAIAWVVSVVVRMIVMMMMMMTMVMVMVMVAMHGPPQ